MGILNSISYVDLYSILPQEHHVRTRCGSVSVIVYGDQDKPALITYPDLALNRKYNSAWLVFISDYAI